MNGTHVAREAEPATTPSVDRAYVEWMLRVAPDKRTMLMAFRAGYLAQPRRAVVERRVP